MSVTILLHDHDSTFIAAHDRVSARKRLLRLVIQAVTVTVEETTPPQAQVAILWSGGATTTHTVVCPPAGTASPTR